VKGSVEIFPENLVPRTDCFGLGEHGDIVRRAEDQIGALSAHRGNDERIPQFLALAVEGHDAGAGVVPVVFLDGLLEKHPLRPGLLVPDDQIVGFAARRPAAREP